MGLPPAVREGVSAWQALQEPPPSGFSPWPFRSWRIELLRQATYTEPHAGGATFGADPIEQGYARPGEEPANALESCVVSVGLLFTEEDGGRLLIGALPEGDTRSTRRPEVIDAYLETCRRTPFAAFHGASGGG